MSARHCLLVEDEPSIRFVFERFLRREGWQVTSCADGPDALAWLAVPHPPLSCVITDIMLPQQTGPAWVAEAVRRGLLSSDLPVCFASGYHDPFLLREATAVLSQWRLLEKPLRMPALAAVLADLTQGSAPD